MRLPNADSANVDRQKLAGYLLSSTHPIGRSKAKFFRSVGFTESNIAVLEQALREIIRTEEVAAVASTPHGVKYIIDGLLIAPLGSRVRVRTIWIVDTGADYPRFVTAYPI